MENGERRKEKGVRGKMKEEGERRKEKREKRTGGRIKE